MNRIFALPNEYEISCFLIHDLINVKRQDEDQEDWFLDQKDSHNHTFFGQNYLFDQDFMNWATDFITMDRNTTKTPNVLFKHLCDWQSCFFRNNNHFNITRKSFLKNQGVSK